MRQFFLLLVIFFGSHLKAEEFQFIGKHFLASYKECDAEALTNLDNLKEALTKAAESSGAHILDSVDYIFAPDGLTMVILLSESHASIHTYPEHNACFVDLFTCGDSCSSDAFDKVLQAYLKPQKVDSKTINRD